MVEIGLWNDAPHTSVTIWNSLGWSSLQLELNQARTGCRVAPGNGVLMQM